MMTASHPQALPASSFLLVMAKDILLLLRSFTMATVYASYIETGSVVAYGYPYHLLPALHADVELLVSFPSSESVHKSILYQYLHKAVPYLERFLEVQTKDTNAMFVLARAYYTMYEFDKACALYDRIIEINPNPEKTAEAQANKKIVLDAQYSN